MKPNRPARAARLVPTLALVFLVGACGASAATSRPGESAGGSGGPGLLTQGPVDLTPVPGGITPDPGANAGSGSGSGSGGSNGGTSSGGGSAPGNPGTDVPVDPGTGGTVPGNLQPGIVSPVAGLVDVHAVGAADLLAGVNGRHVTIRVAWWSGTEPCNTLAGVDVVRDGATFTLTVREGSTGAKVACDEMARYKGTFVDLGDLDPGTYTVKAFGDAPAIQVDVKG